MFILSTVDRGPLNGRIYLLMQWVNYNWMQEKVTMFMGGLMKSIVIDMLTA